MRTNPTRRPCAATARWLHSFFEDLGCSTGFRVACATQLRAGLIEQTGIDPVKKKLWLAPVSVPGCKLWYNEENAGHVLTNLIRGGHGYWVEFSWRCLEHRGERIEPPDEPSAECRLEFRWERLEISEE